MKKKLWKQIISVIITCTLITGTADTNIAFASVSRNNITAVNISKKAATNGSEKDSTRKSTNEEENSPEYNKILTECKKIKTGKDSTELRRGEIVTVESVSGEGTKMAIMSNGDLYCWGNNTYGRVGNGSTENQLTPYKVLSGVKSVTYSSSYSCSVAAILENGDLYCWGYNEYGQAGNGSTENQLTPYKVLSGVKSITYSSSYSYSSVAAILENGDLYCWGYNEHGQAGNGSTNNQLTPYKVLSGVKSVTYSSSYSSSYSCSVAAILENGDLYCWGDNEHGQAGNGSTKSQLTPYKVLSGVKSVTSSSSFVVAILENGDLYCWGDNFHGQVGNGLTKDQRTPYRVLSGVKSVTSSSSFVAAILESGDLYCWGYNISGQVGNGLTENQLTPYKVLSGVKSVTYYYYPFCSVAAILENGDLYCWGYNSNGEAGNGSIKSQLTPYKVLSGVKSVTYSPDSYYSSSVAAILENGDLYCWGYNKYGQAGNGSTKSQLTPYKVLSGVKSITYSSDSSVAAILENGDLYCWGYNGYGRIGNGSTADQRTPYKVLSGVKSVTYSSSVAAILENGDLYCWGYNGDGEVGNGSTENQLTPYKVSFGTLPPATETTIPPYEIPATSSVPSTTQPVVSEDIDNVDNSEIVITARDYDNIFNGELSGAKADVEGIGSALSGSDGKAHIKNTISVPSDMKRISITKDGYRDYILYTTIVSPENVSIFMPNQINASLKKKKAGDDTNPYISTVVYYMYGDTKARNCDSQYFERSDNVTFRACGVWNDKKPGHYCMYEEGGSSFESDDGIFKLEIGKSFSGNGKIYVKMVADDGTESEPELVDIRVQKESTGTVKNDEIPILNETGESDWLEDIPFLNNDKLAFNLGKLKATIKRNGAKVRIILGADIKGDIFDDEVWSDWKKYCEKSAYYLTDLSLSEWANVVKKNTIKSSWTENAKIKLTGYGWLENDLSKDSTAPLTGGVQVIIDASTTFQQQYLVGVIPVYLEETFGISEKVIEGSVTFDTSEMKFGGSNSVGATPSFSVGGGVGVLYAVTLGVKGSASMPVEFNIPKGLTSIEITGGLSIEAYVLGFSYSKEIVKTTPYPLFPPDTAKTRTKRVKLLGQDKNIQDDESFSGSLYDMDSYSLPDETITEPVWHGESSIGNNIRKASTTSSNLTETLLQTGTSPLSEPVLVQEGDTTLAVFLTEDSSRSVIHRSQLVYTVYNKDNGTWSEPVAVCEDGTGDFNPYISAANGKIAVSWLDYDSSITDSSSMKEALQSSKICYAVWNTDTKSFVKPLEVISSSESASYNGAHPYIDSDGNVTQVGIKNSSSDIFGISGDNILFMSGTCRNNKIDKEFTLSQGIPVSYDIAEKEGVITAAVCIDTDKDITTLDDREIYTFSSDGTIKRLTENDTYDSAPQYAKYNGNDALYFYTEEGYKIFSMSGVQLAVLEEDMGISENFTVVNGEDNETAVVWSCADGNSVYQLVASILDKESGKWSSQVVLSGSEEDIFRPSGYFNKDGNMEFIYRKGNTAEAGSLYALQVKQAPDLQLANAYIKDGTEIPGKTTKVFAGVRNLGTGKVTKYSISVDGQVTEGTTEILPGESKLLEAEYKVPGDAKYGEIPVEVIVEGDTNTTNNTFQLATGYADISVVATEDENENGKIVHLMIENCEAVPADAVLEVHKDTKDGELVSSANLGTLKHGDIVTTDFIYEKLPTGYDVDADALYYVVASSATEKYDSNNYDYTVFIEDNQESDDTVEPTETPGTSPSVVPPTETPGTSPSVVPPAETPGTSPSVVPPAETPGTSPSVVPPAETPGASSSAAITSSPVPSNSPTPKPSGSSSGTGTASGGGGGGGFAVPAVVPSASPTVAPSPATVLLPVATPTPEITPAPVNTSPLPSASTSSTGSGSSPSEKTPVPSVMPGSGGSYGTSTSASKVKTGMKVTVNGLKYKVISATGKKTVQFTGAKKNIKKLIIPSSVRIKGSSYKVVSVAASACKNYKKLKKLTIGDNVSKIGKNAFNGCKKLKKIIIKTKKLTIKKTGSNAFKGINKKVKIKAPKSKVKVYKKLIKTKG